VGSDDEERERRLRGLRLERREQQEELEAAMADLDAAAATLASALVELGERGLTCTLDVGPHRLSGLVSQIGEDTVRLVAESGSTWDVALARVATVAVGSRAAGVHRVGAGHPRTLLARARELAVSDGLVEIGRSDRAEVIRGRLVAVTASHLVVERAGMAQVLVAWPAVAWLSEG
jgi:hypothetical protein